jgi:Ca2+-binding RTX toxin-like protein
MLGDSYTTSWQPLPCTVTGTPGDDVALSGSVGDDVICGLGGNDVIHALSGNDTILGGVGADVAYGEGGDHRRCRGADQLIGGSGNDRLTGDGAKDIHRGWPDDDYPFRLDRAGGDRLLCGGGINRWAWEKNDIVRC